ncbi:MAG: Gfo/Idh/MocA family protein [Gammaproteobacteria bacterium]
MKTRSAALRWGFVGTGKIANWMADVVRKTPMVELAAVASRSIDTASAFAMRHGAGRAFGSWAEMLAWEGIDAVYVATPTALREEICIAAAAAGKHVLAEKPFASLASLRRITAACRDHGVAFMDATHFVHHPRTAEILARTGEITGRPQSLESSFLVTLADRSDIRYDPALEPLGALGDLGWYNMRAVVEYLSPERGLRSVHARLRRDPQTGAIIAGEGSLTFEDDTVCSWRCGFDADTVAIELRLSGRRGEIQMDNFIGEDQDGSATYRDSRTGEAAALVRVASPFSAPSLMFQDFAASAGDASLRERWILASERTQSLLDAVREAAEKDIQPCVPART